MNKKNIIITLSVLLIILIIYFLVLTVIYPDISERAQFGDMFGALNVLFSGFALGGIIYTILIQKEELRLQREELQLTREELKRTAEAQEKSEQALSKQATSLKITAKLNGKSAILQHYNTLIEMSVSARFGTDPYLFNERKAKADKIIEEINGLIEDK